MIDLAKDNYAQVKAYRISYHSDEVLKLLADGETIRFSFSGDQLKVYFTDARIILEECTERKQYSMIRLSTLNYLQLVTDEIDRRASTVGITFGLRDGTKLELDIEDETDLMSLQAFLASKIFF